MVSERMQLDPKKQLTSKRGVNDKSSEYTRQHVEFEQRSKESGKKSEREAEERRQGALSGRW